MFLLNETFAYSILKELRGFCFIVPELEKSCSHYVWSWETVRWESWQLLGGAGKGNLLHVWPNAFSALEVLKGSKPPVFSLCKTIYLAVQYQT